MAVEACQLEEGRDEIKGLAEAIAREDKGICPDWINLGGVEQLKSVFGVVLRRRMPLSKTPPSETTDQEARQRRPPSLSSAALSLEEPRI
jgi:hypothetical protein